MLGLFRSGFAFPVTSNDIARAHRPESFVGGKCRPVLIKISSFKIKEWVLYLRSKMSDSCIGVSEDVSVAARH